MRGGFFADPESTVIYVRLGTFCEQLPFGVPQKYCNLRCPRHFWGKTGRQGGLLARWGSRRPLGTHFGAILGRFWSQFGAPGNLGNRAPVEAGARFSSKSRAPCGLRPRRRSGTDSGGILAHFLIDFRGPRGPTTAPRVARSAPRAAQEAEKGSERASCLEVALREAPGVDFGASGGRCWTLRGSISEPLGDVFSMFLKHPQSEMS